ncbi:hypothetical protein DFP73DRAFT_590785 [Morchella snyderi]|nr:hypothetical protein DFP73DRAFT_590785 [Morchella snyderi]
MPPHSSLPTNPSSSALRRTGGDRLFAKMFASSRFAPSNSHGYFWDVEEVRHQEHLRRVSHAQHLYRHRHDSPEAAKLYRSFMEEQNEWMNEQERMKEMELRLSVEAYQRRASRWEDEWKRLEEGVNVEEVLKPRRKSTTLLVTASSQYGYLSFSSEENSTQGLSDPVSPRSISSLDLPSPLLSFPCSSYLAYPEGMIHQMDGAQHSKGKKAPSTPRFSNSNVLDLTKTSIRDAYTLVQSQKIRDQRNSQPESFKSRDSPSKSLNSYSETTYSPKDTPASSQSRIMSPEPAGYCAEDSNSPSSVMSLGFNWSLLSPHSKLKQEQTHKESLANGEVFGIINHNCRDNGNLLYLISWRLRNSSITPVQSWVSVADLFEGPRRSILEKYHRQHNLGPVRWPRNPRRQLRSSTSFGVREIKAALDERKLALLERGANVLDVARELDEERWKMRGDWQRAGRGWGSAIMVVEEKKKAWRIADLEAENSLIRRIGVTPVRSPGIESSGYEGMLKAAGIIDVADSRSPVLKVSNSSTLRGITVSSPKIPTAPLESSFGGEASNPKYHDESERKCDDKMSRFMGTTEDEREWREHFGLEPGCIEPTNISTSTHSARDIGISKVRSTLRNLPNIPNLNLVRAKTLPEIGKGAECLQVLEYECQGPTNTNCTSSSCPIQSSASEFQSYLKAQRKSLLSRVLSRRQTEREKRKQVACHNFELQTRGRTQGSLRYLKTSAEPMGVSRGYIQANRSNICEPPSPSSYSSFDIVIPEQKTVQTKKSWRDVVWDKFHYFLAPSSQNPIFPEKVPRRTLDDRRAPEKPLLPINERKKLKTNYQIFQNNVLEDSYGCQGVERRSPGIAMSLSRSMLAETITKRTESWAASILPPLRKSKSEPVKLRSSAKGLGAISRRNDTEESDINQAPSQVYIGEEVLSSDSRRSGTYKETGKFKGKGRLETNESPRFVRPITITRTLSQERYLAGRQAERQFRRDKELLKIKDRVRMRKEKADQRADDLKRLDELRAKRAFPFSKWKKTNQLELDLLAKKLGVGVDRLPAKRVLKNTTVADIKNLRRSIVPTISGVRNQPKERFPI